MAKGIEYINRVKGDLTMQEYAEWLKSTLSLGDLTKSEREDIQGTYDEVQALLKGE